MPVSDAGVVLPEAAADAQIRQFIVDVTATVGGAEHPSGAQGIGPVQLERFLTDAAAYLGWRERGQIGEGESKTKIMPLGGDTPAAYAIVTSIGDKIDQYFAQCLALSLDERFAQRMGWTQAEVQNLDLDDPAVIEEVLKKAPLTRPKPSEELSFENDINPYYAKTLERLRRDVVRPILGKRTAVLSAKQWQNIKDFFAPHRRWLEAKAGSAAEPLGADKLREYLDESFADAVRALIAQSNRTAAAMDKVRLLEKVILYQAWIVELANNFVSFPHLYDTNRRAMFEVGTLVMDGRRFNLAVRAGDRARHAAVAATSNMYVLYVEISPKADGPNIELAVPVTSGDKGNLCIGKRGVFYDTAGTECDAKVVDIIENPISFKEALLSPLHRLGGLLIGKIESITTSAEKKLQSRASAAMDQVGRTAGPAANQPLASSRAGLLMGAGLAVAALGSAVAYITKTLAQTSPPAIIIGIVGAILLVMLPMSIVAFLKLRKRDLSAILEGAGWGINARMRLTRKQGRFFTERPEYPRGSKELRQQGLLLIVAILILLAAFAAALYLLQ
jgi:hypothetical protein